MPELPDVEVYKQYLDATALHQRIERVQVHEPDLLSGTSVQGLGRILKGRTLETTRRHGKYLLVAVDDDHWLALHFGMTGELRYFGDGEDEPDYSQCLIAFDNGMNLAYVSRRKLGRIFPVKSPAALIDDRGLGEDALAVDEKHFRALAAEHRGSVKSWLMNQAVIAGIGNVYSDEILFQAGIYPGRSLATLDSRDLTRLYRATHFVLESAISARVDPQRMPAKFLLPHRNKGGRCPKCDTPLKTVKIASRTGWYCPQCQKR
jgi:formamidopyrimidine-DNA glycosylase